MNLRRTPPVLFATLVIGACSLLVACGGNRDTAASSAPPAQSAATPIHIAPEDEAPAPDSTGGFDGRRAYQYVADQVAIGPRTAGTDGNRRTQEYIVSKLRGFGCQVEEQPFNTPTPAGTVAMKNIVAKTPGTSPETVLFATHFDTKRLPNFVGADDGGSSTGVMLELARLVCTRKNALTVSIVFLDGEEAFGEWSDTDSTYGSRELAARMALSGDLTRVKAFVLADLIGSHNLRVRREANSTPWLTDLVWSTAARLGYSKIFVSETVPIEDDHLAFVRRKVPSVDIVRCCSDEIPYWHTAQDTLDKISPKSLAIVGHVLIAVLPELEKKFATGKH